MNSHLVIALALSVSAAALSVAQQPKIVDTQLRTEPVSAGLSATVTRFQHDSQPLWVGYEVASLPRHGSSACDGAAGWSEDGCCSEYRLEGSGSVDANEAKAEPSQRYVLLRIDHGAVEKVRVANAGCRLNAGGVAFVWLTGVSAEDSVRYLAAQAGQTQSRQVADGALAAVATHATPVATTTLAAMAQSSNDVRLREKAAFWLGAQRGRDGYLALKELARVEKDPKLREKLAFDLSISHEPEAIDSLLAMAHSDEDPHVRSQAIFWLAQKAGKKTTAAIANAIDNDPEQQVKKKAVFSLSLLPKDEGIPQLIHVADTNSNLAIRKEAMFWLGRSGDPRALAYLESVLKR